MANSDSFIEEVSEELRRDRLFALMRKWGWLLALIVAGIVGGAAFFEYQRAQDRAAAEAFGDALLGALERADPADRVAALDAIPAEGASQRMVLALLAAGEAAQDGDGAEAAAMRLRDAAEAADVPRHYRDLALLRAEMLAPSEPEMAQLILTTLAEPGAPYAALAEEQLAMLDIRAGDLEAGLDRLRSLERSAAATPGLQQRASQLIVALEAGAQLSDVGPEPETGPEPDGIVPFGGDGTDLLPGVVGNDAGEAPGVGDMDAAPVPGDMDAAPVPGDNDN